MNLSFGFDLAQNIPTYKDVKSLGWNANNDCQGKLCRHKCRCEYRCIYDGTDYYTGSNLKNGVPIKNEQHRAKFLHLIYCDKVQLSKELPNEKMTYFLYV